MAVTPFVAGFAALWPWRRKVAPYVPPETAPALLIDSDGTEHASEVVIPSPRYVESLSYDFSFKARVLDDDTPLRDEPMMSTTRTYELARTFSDGLRMYLEIS